MKQRGTLTCVLTAASVFTALLLAWRSVTPLVTPASQHPSQLIGSIHWIAPKSVPFTAVGEVDSARIVVIGDSRVMNGVRRDTLDDAGLGPSCVLWCGGADLLTALSLINPTQVRTLVTALSPLSVSPFKNRIMYEIARQKAPVFAPGQHTRSEIHEWVQEETKHLLAKKFPQAAVDLVLDKLSHAYFDESATMTPTGKIDTSLDRMFADVRFDLCMPLQTGRWNRSWLPVSRPKKSNVTYQRQLSTERYQETFEENAAAISQRLRELSRDMDVVVVRLPTSPELRDVEDDAVAPERLAKIASEADVPFIDFGTSPHTGDGSHLNSLGSKIWSRQLVDELAKQSR